MTMTQRFIPHETAPQASIHTCWPAAEDLWEEDLSPAEEEFAGFLTALAEPGRDARRTPLVIYAATARAEANARRALGARARVVRAEYGDVWARDTGPVFALEDGALKAVRFRFNGWGGKYQFAADHTIGGEIARQAGAEEDRFDLVVEGGALEFDGAGSVVTTRQCLLNTNRNPGKSEQQVADTLKDALGVSNIIWLDEGLVGDHTDGHVDNIARFIAPGIVACQSPTGADDPNARVLGEIARQLETARDAKGRKLQVVRLPSPGLVEMEGEAVAASHMNWVVGRANVVMPAYNEHARDAARVLARAFRDHTVAARPANAILTGGGAFHCVTCNVPAPHA
ncbi:agmatine deiminase family protein [Marinicauda pacifica]|uniref:agmatine deiminase family protein n=1 Tax=Marinicauda pacifica TaxID=1133559 RepID=UPI0035C83808